MRKPGGPWEWPPRRNAGEPIISLAVEDRLDRAGHLADIGHAVDAAYQPARFVDRDNRRGLGTIFGHPRAHRFLIVVGAALEFVVAAHVAGSRHLGQLELVVIARAAIGEGEAADDALDQRILV